MLVLSRPFVGATALAISLIGEATAQATYGFATLPPGSLLHAQASVIAKAVEDTTKMQIRVIGFGGDAAMFDAVNTKKADFLILDVGETSDALQGARTWKDNAKSNLRLAMTLYPFQMGPFVRKDSTIQSMADLKGKRVPSGWVAQTGNLPHAQAMLGTGGLTYNDVTQVPAVNVIRAADDFKSGKLDVFFFAVGAPKVAEVAASVNGVRYVPLNVGPDSLAALKKVRTEYYFTKANPAPHVAGIDKPTDVLTIDLIIGVGAHVADDAVQEFVRAVHKSKAAMVEGHPAFRAYEPNEAGKLQPRLPHHPGATKFFKEAGIAKG
ncbi:MAG: TAXI family TRAP transporter solute-binding subunit [Burkholderiales bacterium]